MSLFGAIIAGRLVQTDFAKLEPNKFLLTIPEPDKVNHVTIFMTGVAPFPGCLGATVYFNFPNADGCGTWQYLGFICNEKPSAIFKVSKASQSAADGHAFFGMNNLSANVAKIGICVENLNDIQFQDSGINQQQQTLDTFTEFTQKMLESFYNYATSFAAPGPGGEICFPVKTLEQWFTNFQRKLLQSPNFWKTLP